MSEFTEDMFSQAEKLPKEQTKDTRFKEKHSLDSDEEDDDGDAYELLNEDDIEGQEDGTSDVVGGIQITPFNMAEEMEEGHFDKDGMYIYEKDKGLVQDNWMDNIDWVKVKETEVHHGLKRSLADSDEDMSPFDQTATYQSIVSYLQPGENVAKALRRLGGKQNLSASQRLKLKKQKKLENMSTNNANSEEDDKADMSRLTDLADSFVSNGIMDIYEMTFEKISFYLKKNSNKVGFDVPADINDDDAMDMFADNIDKKEDCQSNATALSQASTDSQTNAEPGTTQSNEAASSSSSAATASSATTSATTSDQVQWEYKSDDSETATIHGPHTSVQMLTWSEDGYFKEGALCRKLNATSKQFYSTRRIDFDLYI